MLTMEMKIRVSYRDTDAMGVVYHSNYLHYYEVARTEMLREMGTTYRLLEQSGVMLPVHETSMRFFVPARYDDLLTIRITLLEMPAAKMIFENEVRNEARELVNTGRVTLVFMNAETRRACRAPRWFADLFARHF